MNDLSGRWMCVLWVGFLLAACAGPVQPAPSQPIIVYATPYAPSVQEAQRLIDAATNTAVAVSTSQAIATEFARATEDTASRDATAIALVANARLTEAAAIMAPTQTLLAATATAAPATSTAEAAIVQAAATAIQAANQREHDNTMSTAWNLIIMLLLGVFTTCACIAVLWIGRAYAATRRASYAPETFQVVTFEGVPFYRTWTPEAGWIVTPVWKGLLPKGMTPPADPLAELRAGWVLVVKDVARAGAEVGSLSVNKLSTRKGGYGIASEAAIEDAQAIMEELGAIQDFGSNKGYGWVGERAYIDLMTALDEGKPFHLPTLPNGTVKNPPVIDLSRLPPKQSKATQSSKAVPEPASSVIIDSTAAK